MSNALHLNNITTKILTLTSSTITTLYYRDNLLKLLLNHNIRTSPWYESSKLFTIPSLVQSPSKKQRFTVATYTTSLSFF